MHLCVLILSFSNSKNNGIANVWNYLSSFKEMVIGGKAGLGIKFLWLYSFILPLWLLFYPFFKFFGLL